MKRNATLKSLCNLFVPIILFCNEIATIIVHINIIIANIILLNVHILLIIFFSKLFNNFQFIGIFIKYYIIQQLSCHSFSDIE